MFLCKCIGFNLRITDFMAHNLEEKFLLQTHILFLFAYVIDRNVNVVGVADIDVDGPTRVQLHSWPL